MIIFKPALKSLNLFLLAVFLVLFFYRPIETEDVWWHLSLGQWIEQHHAIPHSDVFNINTETIEWSPTYWLGSYLIYKTYEIGGLDGLKIFRTLFFSFLLLIFVLKLLKHLPKSLTIILALLICFAIDSRILLRPLIFNFLFVLIYLQLLYQHRDKTKSNQIYTIPLLSILWFNLHLGAFVYGTIILAVFGLSSLINYIQYGSEHPLEKTKLLQLILVTIGHLTAFLVNPYGLKGALSCYHLVLQPSGINQKLFFNTVLEMQPPTNILTFNGIWFFLLIGIVLLLLIKNKNTKLIDWLIFIIPTFSYIYSARSIELFIGSMMILIWRLCRNITPAEIQIKQKPFRNLNMALQIAVFLYLSAYIFLLLNQKAYVNSKFIPKLAMQMDAYNPNEAVALLKKHNIIGPVFAWEGYGGSIIWNAYPDLRPLADGRQVNTTAYLDYLNAAMNPEKYWDQIQSKYQFNIAILEANFGTLYKIMDYLMKRSDWKMIYIKGSCVVFIKDKAYALSDDLENFQQHLRAIQPKIDEAGSMLNADNKSGSHFLNPIKEKLIVYSEPLEEGVALYGSGLKGAGFNLLLKAHQITPSQKTKKILQFVFNDLNKTQ